MDGWKDEWIGGWLGGWIELVELMDSVNREQVYSMCVHTYVHTYPFCLKVFISKILRLTLVPPFPEWPEGGRTTVGKPLFRDP